MAFRAKTSSDPVGSIKDLAGLTAPSGHLICGGDTISSAAGPADFSDDVYQELFKYLWNNFSNAEMPVGGGRGASANDDWSADKPISLPDYRGRIGVGQDDMGGNGAANRITAALSGIDGTILGNTGGAQSHTLSGAQNGVHSHTMQTTSGDSNQQYANTGGSPPNGIGLRSVGADIFDSINTPNFGLRNGTIVNGGAGTAHQNTQPTFISLKVIRY